MSKILFTSTVGNNELRIEVANRFDRPFSLECNLTRNGSQAFLELPRRYDSVRAAKAAAARLLGGGLEWKAVNESPAVTDQISTTDEPVSIAWWVTLSEAEREHWLAVADSAVPAEAYAAYKRGQVLPASGAGTAPPTMAIPGNLPTAYASVREQLTEEGYGDQLMRTPNEIRDTLNQLKMDAERLESLYRDLLSELNDADDESE